MKKLVFFLILFFIFFSSTTALYKESYRAYYLQLNFDYQTQEEILSKKVEVASDNCFDNPDCKTFSEEIECDETNTCVAIVPAVTPIDIEPKYYGRVLIEFQDKTLKSNVFDVSYDYNVTVTDTEVIVEGEGVVSNNPLDNYFVLFFIILIGIFVLLFFYGKTKKKQLG